MVNGSMKKVAILQSNYIPWKGYFDIINSVEEFVLYDDVQYTKNDWRNRNKIKTPQGLKWLTIPVFHNLSQRIRDTRTINNSWRKKHWKTLSQYYFNTPFFEKYKPVFEDLYLGSDEISLSKINHRFISAINEILGIKTRISWSTDYKLSEGQTERLVDLCRQLNASEYISGPSARTYIDETLFRSEKIKLTWMDYSDYPEYNQPHPPFAHGTSILDLIFNEGPNATKFMKSFPSEKNKCTYQS